MNKNRDDTSREELRNWLAKQLRVEDVPRPLWGWLEEEDYVDPIVLSSVDGLFFLLTAGLSR